MEQASESAEAVGDPDPSNLGPAGKHNRGWFRPGDQRINRRGRPKRAPSLSRGADQVMLLYISQPELAYRLCKEKAPWIINLPHDFQIVGCHVDAARGLVFTIHSASFPRIARGTPIPEFRPAFNGLRWRRG